MMLLSAYEFTFCPSNVISRIPSSSTSRRTSRLIDCHGRLLSRPRVNGTTQKLHMLSQPRMMLTKALWGSEVPPCGHKPTRGFVFQPP
eukprot:scaffold66_cov390-Prasinococcus_capsulatus_cf.AAC.5